ncbi:MAG: TauD/TfdA family dioxygenase, partial [Ilumatobacter sp.]
MTQMTTTKAGPNLGARVEGLDLRAMTPEEVREILVPLLHEYHVLVIPGEVLEPDELERFARAWGDLLEHPASRVEETPYIQIIFSEGEGDDRLGQWHSDMTWHETPPIITMLQAHVL